MMPGTEFKGSFFVPPPVNTGKSVVDLASFARQHIPGTKLDRKFWWSVFFILTSSTALINLIYSESY